MTTTIVTTADAEAYAILLHAGELPYDTDPTPKILSAGNRIIALAEKIKAQRLELAMQNLKGE